MNLAVTFVTFKAILEKLFLFKFADITDNNFQFMVSIPAIPTAGDNFTMTCIVTGPDRLVLTPQLEWRVEINGMSPVTVSEAEADIGTPTIGETVRTGSATFSSTLGFTKIRTSQARRYSCRVSISGIISSSAFGDLRVQSMSPLLSSNAVHYFFVFSILVAPPVVTVAVSPAVDPIYSSTAVNLTCTAVLAEEVDTATMAMATWTGPSTTNGGFGQQPTDPSRITVVPPVSVGEGVLEGVLVFFPVDFQEDNGLHTCEMIISSNTMSTIEDSLIEDITANGSTTVVARS